MMKMRIAEGAQRYFKWKLETVSNMFFQGISDTSCFLVRMVAHVRTAPLHTV